jgi:xyloglucan-specific exo-beta-1,4-glucanase
MCNDGGLYATNQLVLGSWNDAFSVPGYQWPTVWTPLSAGMQATSFYRVGTSRDNPDYVIAGAQDNSTYYYDLNDWYNIFGGDGMDCFIDPVDPQRIYGSSQHGGLSFSPDGGFTQNWIGNVPEFGEWTTPWMLNPTDPSELWAAYGNVWNSTDGGATWNQRSNFPVNAYYGHPNIACAFDIAPSDPSHMYVAKRPNFYASEAGAFWATSDGGVTWTDRTLGISDSLYITDIAVHASAPKTVWVTMGGFLPGNKVFQTTDAGLTWQSITDNLPNLQANTIVQDPLHANSPLYVGMDVGVWYRNDTMSSWQLYTTDLPNVIVSDLEVHTTTQRLYAATFGRGLWATDLADATVSVDRPNLAEEVQLAISPSPSNGDFALRLESRHAHRASYRIVNTLGATVKQAQLEIQPGNQTIAMRTGLAPGVYYLELNFEGRHLTRKFVVQ